MSTQSEQMFLAESKVILLYVLNKLETSVSHNIFVELLANLSDINYFLFEEILSDLLKEKYILLKVKNDNKMYSITNEGQQVLNLSITMLPGIKKLRIDTDFKEVLTKLKEEKSIVAEYQIQEDNTYIVSLKIIEFEKTELEIKIQAYTKEQVQDLINNWKRNANRIYPEIMNMLSGEI